MSAPSLQAVAWVPDDDPERPWDEAAKVAAEWIWNRSDEENVPPLLVTNTFQNAQGIDVLEDIAQSGGQATPQGRRRFDQGPVLAYVPTERTLDLAVNLARGYSLAVVETNSFRLAEWAASVGAINLLDGSLTVSALPADLIAALDRAIFFGGNNGWTGSHERSHARTALQGIATGGREEADAAAAYVMAQGVSQKGAKRMRALIESMAM